MSNTFRWFSSEEDETRLLSSRSQSPFRGKRSVETLDNSSDNESGEMSETSEPVNNGQMLKDILAGVQKNDKTLESVKHALDEIRGEVHTLHVQNRKLKQEVEELKAENTFLHDKIAEVEHKVNLSLDIANKNAQYSRRNNVRIFGVKENKDENVIDLVTDIVVNRLKIQNFNPDLDIEAAHRVGKVDKGPDPKPRGIIVRMRRSVRDKVMKEKSRLIGSRMAITEDLTKQNMSLYNTIRKHQIVDKAWTKDGKTTILVKESGKITQVNSMSELHKNAEQWRKWVNPNPKAKVDRNHQNQQVDQQQVSGGATANNQETIMEHSETEVPK